MPKKNAPAPKGERAGNSGKSFSAYSPAADADQPTIHVDECPFGSRFVVSFQPRRVDRPSREFRTRGEARTLADALNLKHDWPVIDTTEAGYGC